MRAIVITRHDGEGSATLTDWDEADLPEGDLTVSVAYSGINYKDGLAMTGSPVVARTVPLIPGIDLVGRVDQSSSERFSVGDWIVINGAGLGESRHGGLAEKARVHSSSVVALPSGFTPRQAAAVGTAGFTAMLSVLALEDRGVAPDAGPVLVTGASGGVGSTAVSLLHSRGYSVTASTGRVEQHGDYLRGLGAAEVINRHELSEPGRPLQKARWAAVIDSVGSTTLANSLAQTQWGGTVTACGMAQGAELDSTVMPFILRAVALIGINSVDAPLALRQRAWDALSAELDRDALEAMTSEIGLDEAVAAGTAILAGSLHGRTVVAL